MITSLRHDAAIPRENDGAVRFDDLIERFKVKFVGTLQWTVDALVKFLGKKERREENIPILLETLFVR